MKSKQNLTRNWRWSRNWKWRLRTLPIMFSRTWSRYVIMRTFWMVKSKRCRCSMIWRFKCVTVRIRLELRSYLRRWKGKEKRTLLKRMEIGKLSLRNLIKSGARRRVSSNRNWRRKNQSSMKLKRPEMPSKLRWSLRMSASPLWPRNLRH